MTTAYDLMYILKPTLEESDVEATVEKISSQLKGLGGEITQLEQMGRRRLAYEIDDLREGYYVSLTFKSEAAAMKELERLLRLNEDVMRALFIRLEEPKKAKAKAEIAA